MRQVVLINGVPASGKSTVAAGFVDYLSNNDVPVAPFSLDIVKECLFSHVGTGDREYNRMLGRASYHSIFASLAVFPERLVPIIDAWHGFQPAQVLQDHLKAAKIDHVVEVWCKVSPAVAAARYRARAAKRSAGHPAASYADELYELTTRARPLALWPVVEIDAESAVGEMQFEAIRAHLRL